MCVCKCLGTKVPCGCVPLQTLREKKQIYEKEMMNLRSKYEEDAAHFKESQTRALEELSKKHRLTLENTHTSAEKDKSRLLAVSTHTHAQLGSHVLKHTGTHKLFTKSIIARVQLLIRIVLVLTLKQFGVFSPGLLSSVGVPLPGMFCSSAAGGKVFCWALSPTPH